LICDIEERLLIIDVIRLMITMSSEVNLLSEHYSYNLSEIELRNEIPNNEDIPGVV